MSDAKGVKAPVTARKSAIPKALADKHADMGKTVSGYLRRGLRLVENAAREHFPLV
jgi:hypothetical protein